MWNYKNKSCFYIFDYLLEPITEIWWLLIFFPPNFGDWNIKKKTLHFWIFDFEFHFLVKLWQLKKKGLLGCKTMTHSFTYVVVNLYLYILSWVTTVHLNTISVRSSCVKEVFMCERRLQTRWIVTGESCLVTRTWTAVVRIEMALFHPLQQRVIMGPMRRQGCT